MKKVLLLLAVSVAVMSCGSDEEKAGEVTACSCVNDLNAMEEEMMSDGGSPEMMEKFKAKMAECKQFKDEIKGKSKEELEEMCK